MNTNFSLATPATNRFETILADFVSTPSGYYADVKIVTVRNVPSITKSGLLEQALTHSISGLADQIIEPVECSKYTLDGNQACSVIYSHAIFATLTIMSEQGDHLYMFTYQTTKNSPSFDKYLPIAEHMINSFKFGSEAANP
jgi:hypothetical protein